jgi:hypothetical protein
LAEWLGDYEKHEHPFPQVNLHRGLCQTCPFNLRCDRGDRPGEAGAIDQLALIPEVPLA